MIYGHYYFFPPTEITAFLKRWPRFQFQTFPRIFYETVCVTVRQTDVEFGSVWESLKVSKLTQAISEGLHRYFRILPNLTIDWSQIDLQVKSNLNVNAQMRTEIDLNESEIDLNESEIDPNESEIDLNKIRSWNWTGLSVNEI